MTILSETTKNVINSAGSALMIVAVILTIIFFVIVISDGALVVGLAFLIAVVMCFIASLVIGSKPHRQIKVIISDEYSAVELYDKYNVTDREGDIWTLVEKEPISNGG